MTDLMCRKCSYKYTVHSATMSLLIKQISFSVFLKAETDNTLVTDGGISFQMRVAAMPKLLLIAFLSILTLSTGHNMNCSYPFSSVV